MTWMCGSPWRSCDGCDLIERLMNSWWGFIFISTQALLKGCSPFYIPKVAIKSSDLDVCGLHGDHMMV